MAEPQGVKRLEVISSAVEHGHLRGADIGDMIFLGDNLYLYVAGFVAGINGCKGEIALSYESHRFEPIKGDRTYPLDKFSRCAIVKIGPQIVKPLASKILEVRLTLNGGENFNPSDEMAVGDVLYTEDTDQHQLSWVGCYLSKHAFGGHTHLVLSHQRPETKNLSTSWKKGKIDFKPGKCSSVGVIKFEDLVIRDEKDNLRNDQ